MEALIIEKTGDTPTIILDPANNKFLISERSLPENANGFYAPVFKWFNTYSENPDANIVFIFKLEYFNTASAKQIAKILLTLEHLSNKSNVLIKWFYKKGDLDMMSSGLRYSKLLNVKFDIEEYQ